MEIKNMRNCDVSDDKIFELIHYAALANCPYIIDDGELRTIFYIGIIFKGETNSNFEYIKGKIIFPWNSLSEELEYREKIYEFKMKYSHYKSM